LIEEDRQKALSKK
jgi:hypothetical protein